MSHDQNFKNLIVDYPRESIGFFAAVEAQAVDAGARILPNMAYAPQDKLLVYAQAMRGLLELEPAPEKRLIYLDFIDIYADLDDNERQRYTELYPQEVAAMTGFAQRFRDEGRDEGQKEGLQHGEARILTALLRLRFGELPVPIQQRIEAADADTLLRWSERVLTATALEEVLVD